MFCPLKNRRNAANNIASRWAGQDGRQSGKKAAGPGGILSGGRLSRSLVAVDRRIIMQRGGQRATTKDTRSELTYVLTLCSSNATQSHSSRRLTLLRAVFRAASCSFGRQCRCTDGLEAPVTEKRGSLFHKPTQPTSI